MSVYIFGHMRSALGGVSTRQRVATPVQMSLPAYSGLHCGTSLPRCMTAETTSHSLAAPSNGSTVFMMRHGKRIARLGRPQDQRKALVRSLTTEVLRHGRITTTLVKAKAIRKYVDKMIQLAKRGDLHARRQVLAFVYDPQLVSDLFNEVGSRYSDRNSGYCRVIKDDKPRRGDGAPMAIIELV